MKRGGLIAIAGVAVAGCALLAYAMPRAHPAASWNIRSDRQQSIVKARDVSAALGVETSTWEVAASGESDGKRGYYADHHPEDDASWRFTRIYPRITFSAPGKGDRVIVRLSAAGDVNEWERKGRPKTVASAPNIDVAAQGRAIAENALQRLAGAAAGQFRPVTDAAPTSGTFAQEL